MQILSERLQIVGFPLVNAGAWTAIVNPLSDCRTMHIFNPDIVSPLYLCTDTSDANSVQTIAAGADITIALSPREPHAIPAGAAVFYLKGPVPIIHFTV